MTTRGLGLMVTLLGSLVGTEAARARLGETREECVARYGAPVAEVPALLEGATGASFLKGEIRIRMEFLEGRAAFVSFSRRGLGQELRQELLELNAGPLTWNPPGEFLGRTCWTAPGSAGEAARHASAYQAAEVAYLDLATDRWAKAMKAQQAVQFAVVPRAAESAAPAPTGAVAPAAPAAKGKLEGF